MHTKIVGLLWDAVLILSLLRPWRIKIGLSLLTLHVLQIKNLASVYIRDGVYIDMCAGALGPDIGQQFSRLLFAGILFIWRDRHRSFVERGEDRLIVRACRERRGCIDPQTMARSPEKRVFGDKRGISCPVFEEEQRISTAVFLQSIKGVCAVRARAELIHGCFTILEERDNLQGKPACREGDFLGVSQCASAARFRLFKCSSPNPNSKASRNARTPISRR